ncbi:flavin reductase family protein [Marinobacter sp.]|uniref:flavin reductase family protein n=1 Tax=Marinobacter sp. TaxID=50741 RepID=UPI003A91F9B8
MNTAKKHQSCITDMGAIDKQLMRKAMGSFATGVTVVSFYADGEAAGMTANAFMSVSLDPALIVISVRSESKFNDWVHVGDCYGVNILVDEQEHLSSHFGGKRIDGLQCPFDKTGEVPLLPESSTQVVARTVDIHRAGDHLLYIAEVEYLNVEECRSPLLFHNGKYRRVDNKVAHI